MLLLVVGDIVAILAQATSRQSHPRSSHSTVVSMSGGGVSSDIVTIETPTGSEQWQLTGWWATQVAAHPVANAPMLVASHQDAHSIVVNMDSRLIGIQTGEVIPNSQIIQKLKVIDEVKKDFADATRAYYKAMKVARGGYEEKKAAAVEASNECAGGRRTQVWDKLHAGTVVISMVVTAPPAKDKWEASENEERLKLAIFICGKPLPSSIIDIWASVKEFGTLSQTYIYVRFPYHLCQRAQTLALKVSQLEVESHKFSARLSRRAGPSCLRKKTGLSHGHSPSTYTSSHS